MRYYHQTSHTLTFWGSSSCRFETFGIQTVANLSLKSLVWCDIYLETHTTAIHPILSSVFSGFANFAAACKSLWFASSGYNVTVGNVKKARTVLTKLRIKNFFGLRQIGGLRPHKTNRLIRIHTITSCAIRGHSIVPYFCPSSHQHFCLKFLWCQ